jgi:hypothetical protein
LFTIFFTVIHLRIHAQDSLRVRVYKDYLLTHQLTPAGPIPTALDPNGVYPYTSYVETSNRPILREYQFITLENAHLKVTVCPDLGGKVMSIVHAPSHKEVLYVPSVIKPVRILPRFYFVAGGIEVSFPISHSPTQNDKVLFKVDNAHGRVYVTCGERELRFGMQWSVEYSLGVDEDFLTQRIVLHNPGTKSYPWMSWSNAALPSARDTEFHFPKGKVLSHSSSIDTIDWERNGPHRQSAISEMTGFFWKTKDVNAFGAYTPSLGSGLYHIADASLAPGIKLWSYGIGADSTWATLSTAERNPYLEIQGGPIGDQSVKLELKPGETRWHSEFWIPTDKPVDIYHLKTPAPQLRPLGEIPQFSWARGNEVNPWLELLDAFTKKTKPTIPPAPDKNLWPPSGMESLQNALDWAAKNSIGEYQAIWKYYYGTWLAGCGYTDQALSELSGSEIGLAKVLNARLLKFRDENKKAAEVIRSVPEPWLQLHPQIAVERDKLLRSLGKQTLAERETWLKKSSALEDEGILERRVQLLIDKNQFLEAKKLLLSIKFQKVHQTYTRTNLWRHICGGLKEPFEPIPLSLGEDKLANFGAYREFEK